MIQTQCRSDEKEDMRMDRKLKVLMLNGSPRENGNIALAFREMEQGSANVSGTDQHSPYQVS